MKGFQFTKKFRFGFYDFIGRFHYISVVVRKLQLHLGCCTNCMLYYFLSNISDTDTLKSHKHAPSHEQVFHQTRPEDFKDMNMKWFLLELQQLSTTAID